MTSPTNRRDFIIRSAFATSAAVLARSLLSGQPTPAASAGPVAPPAGTPPAPAAPPAVATFTPLRRNVGYFTQRGGTIGWLASPDALLCVDTQFPDTAEKFVAGLPGRNDRQFDVVLNTHHHGDHTNGNPVLKPIAKKIVAHANVPDLQRAAAERAKTPFNPLTLPDETYPESWKGTFGDEVVRTRYFGPAHTKGDVVVTFEKANVIHMGDLVFNRTYPVIDRAGGANIKAWISVLEKVSKEYPAVAIYIFGHAHPKLGVAGVSGKRSDLLVLRDFLTALLDYTQKEIKAGKPKTEIVALENFPGFPDFHQALPNRLGTDLGVAYDELTS